MNLCKQSGMFNKYRIGFNVYFRNQNDAFNFELECPENLMLLLSESKVNRVFFYGNQWDNHINIAIYTNKGIIKLNTDYKELANRLNKESIIRTGLYINSRHFNPPLVVY